MTLSIAGSDPWFRGRYRIEGISAEPLSVPLLEPFVIATGRVEVTQSVLVTARVRDLDRDLSADGLGEAASFPGVSREAPRDVLFSVLGAAASLRREATGPLSELLDPCFVQQPVARAGVEMAVLDAVARLMGSPLHVVLGSSGRSDIVTDITIPIGDPVHMGELAAGWWTKGFRQFKVKVGRGLDNDLAALEAIHRRTPDAQIRLDANAGCAVNEAIALVREATAFGIHIECFEQPCGRLAFDAMASVTEALDIPVVADESVCSIDELARVIAARAARGVNLKLGKSGGPLAALAIGRAARAAGFSLMVGAMVETRLGITAAAHVATALGGVEFSDLDTAFLLSGDPFVGGYTADGPRLTLLDEPGLGVSRV